MAKTTPNMIDELIKSFFDKDFKNFNVVFTHSSYINENLDTDAFESNERLEYLGDAVITYVVSDYLYKNYPQLNEGELSKIRSEIINQKSLADYSKNMNLGSYLILGKGEENNNGRNKISTLCNLFEALIGYMSLNIGISKTKSLLIDVFEDKISYIFESKSYYDSKSLLQEKLQENGLELPKYDSKSLQNGYFEVDLFIDNKLYATAKGSRKIDAEKEAARLALNKYTEL